MSSDENDIEGNDESSELENAARAEQEFLQQRLREELGREASAEELDEWLRQHTEGY